VDVLTHRVEADTKERLDDDTSDRDRRHQAWARQGDRPYVEPNPVSAPDNRPRATSARHDRDGRARYRLFPPTPGPGRSM
jgi:translation initiation factor IF-1